MLRRLSKALTGLILSCVCASGVAHGAPRDITLAEAIEIAQGGSKSLSEIESRRVTAEAQLKVAESHWYPVLSLDSSLLFWTDENKIDVFDKEELTKSVAESAGTLDPTQQAMLAQFMPMIQTIGAPIIDSLPESIMLKQHTTFNIGLTGVMPLTPLFKVYQATKLANLGIDNVGVELDAKKLSISYEVTDVYLKLVYAQMMTGVAEEALDTISKHVELARKYEDVGMIRHSDVLSAQVEEVNARQKVVEARNATRLAAMKLAQTLSMGRGVELRASNMPHEGFSLQLDTLEAYQDRAISQRTELKRLDIGREAAERRRNMALLDYIPQVMLIGRYQFNYGIDALYPKNQAFIGLGMQWTIFDAFGHYFEAKMAEASASEIEYKTDEARDLIELEVAQKYLALSTAIERASFASEALKLADENLRNVNAQFEQGESVNTDVLAAQTKRSSAKADFIKAKIDIITAYSGLLLSLGENPVPDGKALD